MRLKASKKADAAGRAAMALALACGWLAMVHASFAQNAAQPAADLTARDKEACTENLKKIFSAIEAYQAEHQELPSWLSDLVPQYLPDFNTLVCPVCRRTGRTEGPPLADPKIPSSYLFEFCPVPLGREAPNAPTRTRRDWKRRQMGLVGSKVPIVRCRLHDPVLNLGFDGTIYESPGMWELNFTNRIAREKLAAAALFANEGPGPAVATASTGAKQFPARDPNTKKQLLDLSAAYNARLDESWHGGTENQLDGLVPGVQTLEGIDYDIRGLVQLGGRSSGTTNWPTAVKGIPVHQKCAQLHFLHAAAWGKQNDEGKLIGSYVVHFAVQNMLLQVPIVYGQTVRDWHEWSGEKPAPQDLVVAWRGVNGVSKRSNSFIRLFRTTWANPAPELEIESIDFVSSDQNPGPFLVAITVE